MESIFPFSFWAPCWFLLSRIARGSGVGERWRGERGARESVFLLGSVFPAVGNKGSKSIFSPSFSSLVWDLVEGEGEGEG